MDPLNQEAQLEHLMFAVMMPLDTPDPASSVICAAEL
jgi:hypothetical protein